MKKEMKKKNEEKKRRKKAAEHSLQLLPFSFSLIIVFPY